MVRTLLLRTPDPMPHEGIFGYVLRVSEANGYDTSWHVFRHAGYEQGEMQTAGFDVQKLASILNKAPSLLAPHAYSGLTHDGLSEYRLNGHPIGRGLNLAPLRLKRPAICPACVKESGFADVCWDATAFVACPAHGTHLLHCCPACSSPLRWLRPGLLTCSCGASLADAVTEPATPATIALMTILRKKIRGDAVSELNMTDGGLPTEQLLRVPLGLLLRVLAVLKKLNKEVGQSRGGTWPASDAFAEWPLGFHRYLRRMANDGIASNVQAIGLRKKFETLFGALFKRRDRIQGIEFIREEFVRFGLDEWGGAVVDNKLLRSEPDKQRFVSEVTLATRLGVRPITVRNWTARGFIQSKTVQAGKSLRYIADAAVVDQTPRCSEERLQARAAGKLSGLPVSVLQQLKRSGHYSSNPIANGRMGYWPDDLKALTERVIGVARKPTYEVDDPSFEEDRISLDRILALKKLGEVRSKGVFLAEVLDGRIVPSAKSGSTLGSLMFDLADVESFRIRQAVDSDRQFISAKAAGSLVGTHADVVTALVAAGHVVRSAKHINGICRRSVENFLSQWRPLCTLANEIGTSTPALLAHAERLGIGVMKVARAAGFETSFVTLEDIQSLRTDPRVRPSARSRRGKILKGAKPPQPFGALADGREAIPGTVLRRSHSSVSVQR